MGFIDSFKLFFEKIFDFTNFSVYLLIAISFCFLIKKNQINKKEIIRLGLIFIISFAFLIIECAFSFAVSNLTTHYLFNYNLPLIVLIFTLIMIKEKPLTKYIKIAVLIASICITEVLSKYFGILIGIMTSITFIIQLGRIAPTFLFLLTCILINKFDISRYKTFSKEVLIICYALSTVLVVISVFEHQYDNHDLTICLLMSLLDIVLLCILNITYVAIYSIVENRHKITSLEVQNTLVEAENLSISIDKNNREELEKIRHDIKNQLSYVNLLLKQDKKEEAINYIDNYVNSQEVLFSFSCSNNVINSIINLELSKAKVYGVKMNLKIVVPPALPFDDNDIVSLLTNMIDNALENYYKIDDNSVISVCILKQNDYIRFFVSNPIDIKKYDKNNVIKTRKNGKNHGYGTKIIKNIASKYNGYVEFEIEDNRFICDVLLYMNLKG